MVRRYFYHLLFPSLGKQKEKEVVTQKEVKNEARNFYRKLYSCKDNEITINTVEEFLGPHIDACPKLTNTERDSIEGQLTMVELGNYLCVSRGARGNISPSYHHAWNNSVRQLE